MERYAILIGIDDPEPEGLAFCCKDVIDFGNALTEFCSFKTGNVFKIKSEKDRVNFTALSELDNTIEILKKDRKINSNDLLLIYFSGHGIYNLSDDKSYLEFPKDSLGTEKIKNYIDSLHPKHSILIFDACFSGAKILSKAFNYNKLKRKLHVDSESVFGIYAAPTEREAYLCNELKNSLLTSKLIESIKNPNNYDADGTLSIDVLASIVSKEVYKHSANLVIKKLIRKEQVIVREGRIEGYLIFAEMKQTTIPKKKPVIEKETENNSVQKESNFSFDNEVNKFRSLLDKTLSNIKSFKPVVAAMVLSYYCDKPYQPGMEEYGEEIREAIRRNFLDDEGSVNTNNDKVRALISSMAALTDFLTHETRTHQFDEYFSNQYGISPNEYENQDFWERVFSFKVPKEYY